MKKMQFHEAANIFPLMDSNDLASLTEDIRKNGQRESIKVFDGLIVDGRNRYLACEACGCEAKFETVKPSDPVAYVVSLNLHRRHLTLAQSAMCAARAREVYEKQAKERQQVRKGDQAGASVENLPQLDSGKARDKAGAAFGVSGKSVDHATRVIEKGIPELAKAVDEGKIKISRAAEIAKKEPEVQRKHVSEPVPKRVPRQAPEKKKKEYQSVVSTCVQYGQLAILQLERINPKDKDKELAFQMVENWIKKAREQK